MTTITCDICAKGCDCELGTPGCEHYGCWGTVTPNAGTCPDVPARRTEAAKLFARL